MKVEPAEIILFACAAILWITCSWSEAISYLGAIYLYFTIIRLISMVYLYIQTWRR